MSIELYNNDCLIQMSNLEDASIDLLFCDLPYGQTSCKWDTTINLELFWKQVNRICKINCPMFFTTTTRFGVDLINSNPKNFRYDLVWVKTTNCGFLNAKKMPMRKHEMLYVFYRKLPLYNLSSHNHKFIDSYKPNTNETKEDLCYGEGSYNNEYKGEARESNVYEPPLPVSVIKTDLVSNTLSYRNKAGQYDPPLPNSVIKVELKNTIFGDISVLEHSNRKDRINIYDPPLPNSIVKLEDLCIYDVNANCYGGGKEGRIKITKNKEDHSIRYEPPLPNSLLEIKSQKGKHSTQKPTELMKWILKYYSKEGDNVLDPTMGSGSMGVACKEMNRKFIGIEKDETIFKSAVKRIEETTTTLKELVDIAGNLMPQSSSSLVSINEDVSPNTHIG
jgi:DNA modification methylase